MEKEIKIYGCGKYLYTNGNHHQLCDGVKLSNGDYRLCNTCNKKMENAEIRKRLIVIEYELDLINGDHGNKDNYCIFCNSKEYNGMVGIVHTKNCIISQTRNKIKELR